MSLKILGNSNKEDKNELGELKPFLETGQYTRCVKRIEYGNQSITELANFIRDRANLEEAYAQSLRKWADKYANIISKGMEYHTTREHWMNSLEESRQVADLHSTISSNLMLQTHKKTKEYQKNHYHKTMVGAMKEVQKCEKDFTKASKPWTKQYNINHKSKQAYYDACKARKTAEKLIKETELAIESAQKASTPVDSLETKVAKQTQILKKKEADVDKLRETYKQSITDCTNAKPTYIDDMTTVYEKTNIDELRRLKFVKEVLVDAHKIVNLSDSDHFHKLYTTQMETLNKINNEGDIDWWNNAKGMGIEMHWPVFEEYDPEAALQSVTHKQSQRSGKHIAGSTTVSSLSYRQSSNDWKDEFEEDKIRETTPNNEDNHYLSDKQNNLSIDSGDNNNNKAESVKSIKSAKAHIPHTVERTISEDVMVEAVFDYTAQDSDEISLAAGTQFVRLEPVDDQGWCKGRLDNGKTGLFPADYVREVCN